MATTTKYVLSITADGDKPATVDLKRMVDPDPVPPPDPGPDPLPTPLGRVYRASGRYLRDPNGAKVVVRGAEQVFWDASWLPRAIVTEIGKSGANAVRVLPYYTDDTPTGESKSTAGQIEEMIRKGIAANMLVDLAVDGGRHPDVHLRPEILALIKKYEPWLVLHAMGEAYQDTHVEWADEAIRVIKKCRAAGLVLPLYIMSRTGGRNLPCILNQGARVFDADPQHNVVFGWQAYWGSGGGYQDNYGMSLPDAFRKAAAAPFPIQVGLMWHSDHQDAGDNQTIPYQDLMKLAAELDLGWLWWDWRMGKDQITTGDSLGKYGKWTDVGEVVATSTYGLKTATRTEYQRSQRVP